MRRDLLRGAVYKECTLRVQDVSLSVSGIRSAECGIEAANRVIRTVGAGCLHPRGARHRSRGVFGIRWRAQHQFCQLGVRGRVHVQNAQGPRKKGFRHRDGMPDFLRCADNCCRIARQVTGISGDTAGYPFTGQPTADRLGGSRSHAVDNTFQPQNLAQLIDAVALHVHAVLLEARRLTVLRYVARNAFGRDEFCKNLSADLIRKPGDDVTVVTECHELLAVWGEERWFDCNNK